MAGPGSCSKMSASGRNGSLPPQRGAQRDDGDVPVHRGRGSLFEPLATTGVPLASREDWPQVLEAAADTGTSTVWVAFHGLGEEHDRQVNRRGAFAETCLAIQRIHAMGLRVGCNVFVTTANLPQLDQLAATLAGPSIDAEMCWETAAVPAQPAVAAQRAAASQPAPAAARGGPDPGADGADPP